MIPKRISAEAEANLRRVAELASISAHKPHELRQIVLGSAAVMEAYVDSVNQIAANRVGFTHPRLGSALISEVQTDLSRNWSRRTHWFEKAMGVQLAGQKVYQDAMVLVDLRNAIAHGSGGLSSNQARGRNGGRRLLKTFNSVLDVGVSHNGELILSPQTASRAVGMTRDLILVLDAEFVGALRDVSLWA